MAFDPVHDPRSRIGLMLRHGKLCSETGDTHAREFCEPPCTCVDNQCIGLCRYPECVADDKQSRRQCYIETLTKMCARVETEAVDLIDEIEQLKLKGKLRMENRKYLANHMSDMYKRGEANPSRYMMATGAESSEWSNLMTTWKLHGRVKERCDTKYMPCEPGCECSGMAFHKTCTASARGADSCASSAHSMFYDDYVPISENEYQGSPALIGGVIGASAIVAIMLVFCIGLACGMISYWRFTQKKTLEERMKNE
eukprot:467072_1